MGAMFWFWAVACLVLLILEAATAMLVSIWFVGGAAAALIVCLCGALAADCAVFRCLGGVAFAAASAAPAAV